LTVEKQELYLTGMCYTTKKTKMENESPLTFLKLLEYYAVNCECEPDINLFKTDFLSLCHIGF